jgi:hypothetical protein
MDRPVPAFVLSDADTAQMPVRTPEPVFVDRTGRRRRLFAVAGGVGAILLALASLVLVAGFTGAGAGYLPTLPEPAGTKARGAVSTAKPSATTRPAGPAHATAGAADPRTTASVPSATPTPPAGVTPSRTNNRKVPTQTPSHKPAKRA